jgi:hypothetical protein
MVILAAVLLYAAAVSGKATPSVIGIASILVAIAWVANLISTRIQLQDGVLSTWSLLDRRRVRVSAITGVVPVSVAVVRQSVPFIRGSTSHILDVVNAKGSTGIWLNPRVYGDDEIRALLAAINLTPNSRLRT